jgi:hypothetical protein
MAISLAGFGCGSSTSSPAPSPSKAATLKGVAMADSAVTSAALQSAGSRDVVTTTPDASGAFTFNVEGLRAPYLLRAESDSGAVYAVATQAGVANLNAITTVVFAASSKDQDAATSWSARESRSADDIERILTSLSTVLKPLFDLYGVTRIDDDEAAVRALLADVSFTVKARQVAVTNKATGAVIFTGSLRDLASGTFHPENMPAGPGGTTPCTYAYDAWGTCQPDGTQTRTVASSTPAGCIGTPVLSQSCVSTPPPPAACQYTYSAWGACQPDGTQARTVVTSGPAGCTGTPVVTQSCTYVPPPPTCTSFTYSAWGACQPDGTQIRTVATSSPSGCTGGSPVLSQACTYTAPCTLATATPSCSTCHSSGSNPYPSSHTGRPLTCASCHGPVNNGSGTPSVGMTATAGTGGACVLAYPFGGTSTHNNNTVNRGAAR